MDQSNSRMSVMGWHVDKQQIFDTVRTHLLCQGVKCVDENGHIRYRHAGKMCAIGVLIPDDMYTVSMETKTVYELCVAMNKDGTNRFILPDYFRPNQVFLHELQHIHDKYTQEEIEKDKIWEIALSAFASRYELTCH